MDTDPQVAVAFDELNRIDRAKRNAVSREAAAVQDSLPSLGLVTWPQIKKLTTLSRSSIYARLLEGGPYYDPAFPRPLRMGRRIVWRHAEIEKWVAQLPRSICPAYKLRRD